MSDIPSPRRKLGMDRKEARPQHDCPCKRIAYSDSKTLFEMLKDEALGG